MILGIEVSPPDAIRILKRHDWPGNVRELKHFVEKIIVLSKGERINADIIKMELLDSYSKINSNPALPVVVDKTTNKVKIDLILRQLFMLKQDTELIQNILLGNNNFSNEPFAKKDIGNIIEKNLVYQINP